MRETLRRFGCCERCQFNSTARSTFRSNKHGRHSTRIQASIKLLTSLEENGAYSCRSVVIVNPRLAHLLPKMEDTELPEAIARLYLINFDYFPGVEK
ncbi:hypothetical protein VTK56DRAFT_8669 [Thermocarpiscus australiensis]